MLARRADVGRLELLRLVQTRGLLAREIAHLIVAGAIADADAYFDEGSPDAPDGDDLHGEIVRAHWEKRDAERRAEWERDLAYDADADAATKAFIAAMKAQQQQASQ